MKYFRRKKKKKKYRHYLSRERKENPNHLFKVNLTLLKAKDVKCFILLLFLFRQILAAGVWSLSKKRQH